MLILFLVELTTTVQYYCYLLSSELETHFKISNNNVDIIFTILIRVQNMNRTQYSCFSSITCNDVLINEGMRLVKLCLLMETQLAPSLNLSKFENLLAGNILCVNHINIFLNNNKEISEIIMKI